MEILKRTLVGSFGTGGRASHLCPPHAGRWTGVHCHPPRRCIATSSHCAPVRAVSSDNLERWDCRLYNVQRLSLFRRLLDAEENRRQKQKKAALEEVVHVEGVGGVRVHEDHRKTTGRPQEDCRKTNRKTTGRPHGRALNTWPLPPATLASRASLITERRALGCERCTNVAFGAGAYLAACSSQRERKRCLVFTTCCRPFVL